MTDLSTPNAAMDELRRIAVSLEGSDGGACTSLLDDERFREWPASPYKHHVWAGGLAQHTAQVINAGLALNTVPWSIIIIGAGALSYCPTWKGERSLRWSPTAQIITCGCSTPCAVKHYLGFMPLSKDIRAEHWGGWADSLDGATGDVIRKVADQLWRSRMATFVKKNPSDADAVIEAVKSLTFDNPRVVEIQLELRKVREDKERIVRSQRYEEAASLRDRERTLTEELNKIAPNVAEAKFSLDALDRVKLVEALRPHVELDADAIDLTVENMLDNVGIAAEIKTAKAVYGKAKTLLTNVREHV